MNELQIFVYQALQTCILKHINEMYSRSKETSLSFKIGCAGYFYMV